MPNYVSNTLIIEGPESQKTKLSKLACSNYGLFDFRKIVKPPQDPAYNDLPSQPAARVGPNWWRTWNLKNWGTKWNCGDATKGLTKDAIQALLFRPNVESLKEQDKNLISLLTGSAQSFLVGLELAKSQPTPPCLDFLKNDPLVYSFYTAWSMPNPVFQKLSTLFPHLDFTVLFADEDIGSNCGIVKYKNNNVNILLESKDVNRDWKKKKFQQFACLVTGYDWEDFLED